MTVLRRKPEGQAGDTILLVDDEAAIRRSVGDMLKRSGYQVILAENGDAALQALQGGAAVDLVITDYRMPGMDGLMLVRQIKERMPDMPAVMLTGHGDLESYLCASDLGVIRYIGKPIRLRELLQTVRDAVSEGICSRALGKISSSLPRNALRS